MFNYLLVCYSIKYNNKGELLSCKGDTGVAEEVGEGKRVAQVGMEWHINFDWRCAQVSGGMWHRI